MSAPRFDPRDDAEIALQGQVDRAAEMALESVGYLEPRFDPTAAKALADEAKRWSAGACSGYEDTLIERLAASLSSAISAIEGPEDGAGKEYDFRGPTIGSDKPARALYEQEMRAAGKSPYWPSLMDAEQDKYRVRVDAPTNATRAPRARVPSKW